MLLGMKSGRDIFKANLAKYRDLKGFSQEKLAELVDLSKQQIYRIEKGISAPPPETQEKLAKALGVRIEDLHADPEIKDPKPSKKTVGEMTVEELQEAMALMTKTVAKEPKTVTKDEPKDDETKLRKLVADLIISGKVNVRDLNFIVRFVEQSNNINLRALIAKVS